MVAVRNNLKHERRTLEEKIDAVMEYVGDNATKEDKVRLYTQLYKIEDDAFARRH